MCFFPPSFCNACILRRGEFSRATPHSSDQQTTSLAMNDVTSYVYLCYVYSLSLTHSLTLISPQQATSNTGAVLGVKRIFHRLYILFFSVRALFLADVSVTYVSWSGIIEWYCIVPLIQLFDPQAHTHTHKPTLLLISKAADGWNT